MDLSDNGINALIKVLQDNDDTPENVACPAPKYNFSGASLRNIYDYHLTLENANERLLHPTLLVVAHHEDYRTQGVLLVNLDWNMECSVDFVRLEASEAVLWAVNLMIDNVEWEEVKELELSPPSLGDDGNDEGEHDSSGRKVLPDRTKLSQPAASAPPPI